MNAPSRNAANTQEIRIFMCTIWLDSPACISHTPATQIPNTMLTHLHRWSLNNSLKAKSPSPPPQRMLNNLVWIKRKLFKEIYRAFRKYNEIPCYYISERGKLVKRCGGTFYCTWVAVSGELVCCFFTWEISQRELSPLSLSSTRGWVLLVSAYIRKS